MNDIHINLFEYYLLYNYKILQDYVLENESYLQTKIINIKSEFDNIKEKFGEEQASEYSDKIEANYIKYTEEFPNILRKSLIVMICSALESSLFEICDYIKNNKDYKISYKDIDGNGINKAKKYLELVCSIDITEISNYWMIINQIYKVRNVIIHNKGIISDINSIKNILEKDKDFFEIRASNEILIKSKFLLYFISISVSYIKEIFKVIKENNN